MYSHNIQPIRITQKIPNKHGTQIKDFCVMIIRCSFDSLQEKETMRRKKQSENNKENHE